VGAVSRPTWEALEAWARVKVQEFVQAVPEEEVTALLGRRKSERRRKEFVRRYGQWYPEAAEVLETDWERMVSFYDFPEAHWKHLRMTNVVDPVENEVRGAAAKARRRAARPRPFRKSWPVSACYEGRASRTTNAR
jgi:transposase-like protein